MSLYGKDPIYSWGAIRNAQLVRIFFPDWKLRIYTLDPSLTDRPELIVPARILTKLRQLGVELALVKNIPAQIPPKFWRYMVCDDADVEYFLVRDVNGRLSGRDTAAVGGWLTRSVDDPSLALHCIRDHPKHNKTAIVDGIWGGRTTAIRKSLGESITSLLRKYFKSHSGTTVDNGFLSNVLYSALKSVTFCHDSASCEVRPNTEYFARPRQGLEYVGEKYDEHHERVNKDYDEIKNSLARCNESSTQPA